LNPIVVPIRHSDEHQLSTKNSDSPQDAIELISSGGEEEVVEQEEKSVEPVISKYETKEALKKYTDKLNCMVYI